MAKPFKDDLEVLNYALTLEHLEATFYRDELDSSPWTFASPSPHSCHRHRAARGP